MPEVPAVRRAISIFDGQNLFRHARDPFGHHHPNFDQVKLASTVCAARGWRSAGV